MFQTLRELSSRLNPEVKRIIWILLTTLLLLAVVYTTTSYNNSGLPSNGKLANSTCSISNDCDEGFYCVSSKCSKNRKRVKWDETKNLVHII